jgi:hypothetical protein
MKKTLTAAAVTVAVAATGAIAETHASELKSAALSAFQALFTDYSEEACARTLPRISFNIILSCPPAEMR